MKHRIARLAFAVGAGVVLAAGLGLQAASSVAERRAPELAVSLNPLNGMAREQWAFARFSDEAGKRAADQAATARAASRARALALASYRAEPLVPKAFAILALATSDRDQRGKVLALAQRLNRRDMALQVVVLDNQVQRGSEAGAIATLDQLLRVHPELSPQFFPLLQQALLNPANEETFSGLLNGSSPWQESFALSAVTDKAARVRLAKLRPRITVAHPSFDPQLISGLAAQGEFELAADLYNRVAKSTDTAKDGVTRLSWRGDFPPFEWQYTDQKEIRARPGQTGDELEVFVRPGAGGVIAKRIVTLPASAAGRIAFKLESTRPIVDGRMRMSVHCANDEAAIVELDLAKGDNALNIAASKSTCRAIRIEIYARSYRGDPVLRARIGQLRVS